MISYFFGLCISLISTPATVLVTEYFKNYDLIIINFIKNIKR